MTYEMRRNPDLSYDLIVEERGQTTTERFAQVDAVLKRADQLTARAWNRRWLKARPGVEATGGSLPPIKRSLMN